MTVNLISQLADAILKRINAKPQSPTKAEIEDTIRFILGHVETPQAFVNYDWLKIVLERAGIAVPQELAQKAGGPPPPRCQHQWSHFPDNPTTANPRPYCLLCGYDIDNRPSPLWSAGGNDAGLMPLPYKSVSAEMVKAMHACKESLYDTIGVRQLPPMNRADRDAMATVDAAHAALITSMNHVAYGGLSKDRYWANKLNEPFDGPGGARKPA